MGNSIPTQKKMTYRLEQMDKFNELDDEYSWNNGIIILDDASLTDKVIEGIRSSLSGRVVHITYGATAIVIICPCQTVFYTGKFIKRAIKCSACAFLFLATAKSADSRYKFGEWTKRYFCKTVASVALDWTIPLSTLVYGVSSVIGSIFHPATESYLRNCSYLRDKRDMLNIAIEKRFTNQPSIKESIE